jgi:hypothetical protein
MDTEKKKLRGRGRGERENERRVEKIHAVNKCRDYIFICHQNKDKFVIQTKLINASEI